MGALRHRWGFAVVALSASTLLGACPADKDVVADVQEIDAATSAMGLPDAGGTGGMPAPQCVLAPGWFEIDEAANQNGCTFKVFPGLLSWFEQVLAGSRGPMGETRTPTACDAAGQAFFRDPEDDTQVIACEATCNAIKQWLINEKARYQACSKAAGLATP